MLKDATYKEKFAKLDPWLVEIVEGIKKDLRNEHLKKDWMFVKYYFAGKNISKLTTEELVAAYKHSIEFGEKCEEVGEFIANRWLLKHTDLYHFFENELVKISPNFYELEVLDLAPSKVIMEKAVKEYGAFSTYLFCVLNSVVFPKEVFDALEASAKTSFKQAKEELAQKEDLKSLEDLRRSYEQQIARITERYEKKILGMQKMYHQDTEMLKKKVSNLQRKSAGIAS